METSSSLSWEIPEYDHKERSVDWYWAVGIIAIAGSVTAIVFKNYLFAVLILLSVACLALLSIHKPETVLVEINEDTLILNKKKYPLKKIHSFNIEFGGKIPLLLILSDKGFLPLLIIPLIDVDTEKVYKAFENKVLFDESLEEPTSHKLMQAAGF